MKKDSELIQKDFSFLQKMSTEELQEILRRDMDLDEDESDMDLVLNVMEVLEARENESESEQDAENALVKLRELINSRAAMFAEDVSSENINSPDKPRRSELLWLRIGSVAALVALVISIGFTAANAKGYDLWGGMVRWTRETFSFGEKKAAFSTNETFEELKEALIQNGITIPVLPTWLQEQYTFDDIRVYSEPSGCRITAIATSNENTLFYQLTSITENDPGDRKYEINGDSVQQYDVNGITHYYMTNEDSVLIIWANNNCQIMMEFSDSNIDAQKIIDSIYVG